MSTHVIDASGQRALSMTLNDPAATRASVPAKAGDDVRFQIGGCREVRIGLPPSARLQKRTHIQRKHVVENGVHVKDDAGEYVYEEVPYDSYYLVVGGGVSVFARSSYPEDEKGENTYEVTPHTTLWVKRNGDDLDQSEQGELVEEVEISELPIVERSPDAG